MAATVSTENLREYTDGCRQFLDYLRSKADASTGFPNVKLSTNWTETITTSGSDAFKRMRQRSVKMTLHTNDAVTSQNWVIAKVDTEILPTQCYHVEIQWLVCRSSLVDDLITGTMRRAKQLGLEFRQVTENGISNNLDIHPMNCPIFLKIGDPHEQELVEKALIERFDFCCEALHAIPLKHLNHNEEYAIVSQEPQPPRSRRVISYYRQYVHRSLACFARMTQTGMVWISNQKVHDDEIQPIFEELRQYVESLQVARSALMGVLDQALAGPSSMPMNAKEEQDRLSRSVFAIENTEPRDVLPNNAHASPMSWSGGEKENIGSVTNVACNVDQADTKEALAAATETGARNKLKITPVPPTLQHHSTSSRSGVPLHLRQPPLALSAPHFPFPGLSSVHPVACASLACFGALLLMAIAAKDRVPLDSLPSSTSSPTRRHTTASSARVAPGSLFRRMSAQAMGMEAAALCHRSHWVPKSSRSACSNCKRNFRLWAGKHHCRLCGEIVCGACSTKRILFQKKSVRTCDDCVDVNVQNISEINRRRSTPELMRSNTSPGAFGGAGRYSLQSAVSRSSSSRGLGRHSATVATTTPRGSHRVLKEAAEGSSTTLAVMDYCSLYRLTFSWQSQVTSLVVVVIIISIAGALSLMAQV
ncbi:hypothetical protein BBJ28_00006446 [Nothophytophthora sp. Chile5]|nr:hypothetical protein BBJ28_00006446 [Nothophytophthora sp. Chile5]